MPDLDVALEIVKGAGEVSVSGENIYNSLHFLIQDVLAISNKWKT